MKQTDFFKRLVSAMLFIVMAISALPVAQAEVQHGYVLLPSSREGAVNFRRDPNTDDNANYPLARLPEYWVVEILGSEYVGSQKWLRVSTNTGTGVGDPEKIQTGYVMADYIKVMTAEEEAAYSLMTGSYYRPGVNMSNPKRPDDWAAGEHAYVLIPGTTENREVNFRRDPNTDDNGNYPIARLPEYWVVEILGSESHGGQLWYHVQTNIGVGENDPANFQTGYVMASFIKIMSAEEEVLYSVTLGNYFRPGTNYLAENGMRTNFDPDVSPTEAIPWIIPTGTVLGYVYIVNGDAMIYNEPSGTAIGVSVPKGTLVPYFEVIPFATIDAYEWLRIAYQGNEGYIREGFYMVAGQTSTVSSQGTVNTGTVGTQITNTVPANTAVPTAAPQVTAYVAPTLIKGQTLGMVTQDNVFFRKDMSTAGDFWGRLPYGWTMTVLDVQTKGKITWYKVKGGTPQNPNRTYTGYIHGDYFILLNSTVTSTPAPWYVPTGLPTQAPTAVPQGDSKYGLVLVDGVNLRQTPGGATVAALRANTVIIIYSRPSGNTANDWYYVKHEGVMGYLPATSLRVLNTYELPNYTLPDGTVVTPSPTPYTLPVGVKGYVKLIKDKVNIRKTPDGDILTETDKSKLPVGMVIAYSEGPTEVINGFTWVKVTNGNITGYIRNDCFSYCDEKGNIIAAPTQPAVTATPVVPGSQGYIKLIKGGVNLRSNPDGTTIAQLAKDTVLPYFNVTTKSNSLETWYEVYWAEKGVFGFILSTMAQQCDAQGNIITPVLPTSDPVSNVGYVATKVSGVWLRATPYADGDIIGQVKQKYTVLPQIGPMVQNGYEWYPVQTADGQRGYLRGDCVFTLAEWQLTEFKLTGKVPTPTPGPATPRPGNSSYIITTMDKVYIRQSPTTKAAAIGQVALGSVMKYNATQTIGKGTANEVTWYQVTYAGQVGWMHGGFVRILSNAEYDAMNATPTPQPGTTAVPTAAPNLENLSDLAYTTLDKVNIRASASMSGRDIYMIDSANTEVTYLGKYTVPDPLKNNNYYWFNVRYRGVTGWIRGDCLHVLTETEKAARKANPAAPVVVPSTEYRSLSLNDSGDDVYALQYKLYQLGYLAGDQVNGNYLATTQAAVRAFQQAKGLSVDGIAGVQTQQALYGTQVVVTAAPNYSGGTNGQYVNGSSTSVVLYPVEKSDWFTGDIQDVWPNGSVAILTDVYTGISFKAQRLYGGNHADCEPVDTADTAAICAIYGVTKPQEIEDREQELQSYRRRPTWVTVGGRTFCASVYGIPHNYSGDRIANNGYTGQFCVHFTNSKTHTSNIVDPDASYNNYFGAQSAIQYAYEHSISGWK